nr:MAG TPA_asm: hypothetical protein [Caudoviricetes sp.]
MTIPFKSLTYSYFLMIFWLNNIQEFFIKIFDEKPTLQTYT